MQFKFTIYNTNKHWTNNNKSMLQQPTDAALNSKLLGETK